MKFGLVHFFKVCCGLDGRVLFKWPFHSVVNSLETTALAWLFEIKATKVPSMKESIHARLHFRCVTIVMSIIYGNLMLKNRDSVSEKKITKIVQIS